MKKSIAKPAILIAAAMFCTAVNVSSQSKGTAPLIRLKAVSVKANSPSDATVIYFYNGATVNYDYEFDSKKLLNTDPTIPNIYTTTPKIEKLAINGLPDTLTDFTVPLSCLINYAGTYSINAYEIVNFDPDMQILLEDTKENITQDLITNPVYTFNITPSENDRFFIHFKSTVTGITSNISSTDSFSAFASGSELTVKCNVKNAKLRMFDMSGREVFSTKLNNSTNNYNLENIKYGTYLVRIESPEKLFVKKIHLYR